MPRIVHAYALVASLLVPVAAMGDSGSELGARIALQGTSNGVAPCMACHGVDGGGMAAAGYPRIAGLDAGYMVKQLGDFRSGKRNNPTMMPMAKGLTEEEMAAVSAHYAALPVPAAAAEPPVDPAAKIASDLARWGDWTGRGLPACGQCHAPGGNGVGSSFPGIAGQHASYIKAQLRAWKAGTRANDPLGLMKAVADRLTEAEADAVAAYYAAQPGAAPIAASKAPAATEETQVSATEVRPGVVPDHGAPPAGRATGPEGSFQPPARDAVPDGVFGDVIREGEAIFADTNVHPVSSEYVGNGQACGNCHLDAGRLAASAPLWAAWVAYPAYRTKNKKVNTYIERIQGCFEYSMNAQASAAGRPPAADSAAMVSLVAYSYWLAKGAPTGDDTMPGRGFPRLKETDQGFDPERGAAVYAAKCALCHGEGGAGVALPDGRTLFPPLWGAESFNWGAGMHRIDTAAAFIKHNMPLGLAESLSDQESWDLAAFINSHERPQDPRYQGDLAATTKEFHGGKFDYYGRREGPDGSLLGERPASK
jgi:thiosulfate dehydrogenase